MLLNLSVFVFIQCINFHDFFKNLFKVIPDLRNWICNDRKAPLLWFDILIHDLRRFDLEFYRKLLLLLA